jgi:hypothetical protein
MRLSLASLLIVITSTIAIGYSSNSYTADPLTPDLPTFGSANFDMRDPNLDWNDILDAMTKNVVVGKTVILAMQPWTNRSGHLMAPCFAPQVVQGESNYPNGKNYSVLQCDIGDGTDVYMIEERPVRKLITEDTRTRSFGLRGG